MATKPIHTDLIVFDNFHLDTLGVFSFLETFKEIRFIDVEIYCTALDLNEAFSFSSQPIFFVFCYVVQYKGATQNLDNYVNY